MTPHSDIHSARDQDEPNAVSVPQDLVQVSITDAYAVRSRKKGTNARLYTWMAIIAMYILALSLWLIDVRNIIAEINLTLLSTSSGSLDDTYSVAVSDVLRLASYETFLYAYLVC